MDLGFWGLTLMLMLTTTIPVKLAASFIGTGYDGMKACALAVIIGTALSYAGYRWLGGGPESIALAFLVMALTYKYVLSTTFPKAIALVLLALVLQLAFIGALASFGVWSTQNLMN